MRVLTATLLALVLWANTTTLSAQIGASATIQNMHLWRGGEVADGFVLTTDLHVTTLNEHLTIGVWGGMNAMGEYKEFNYYAVCVWGGLSLTVVDTYNFSTYATYNNEEFFNYQPSQTGRFLDAAIRYQFSDKFPLQLTWATVIFGRDRDDMNSRNRYSTFCSAEYMIYNKSGWQVEAGLGATFAINNVDNSANFYGKNGATEAILKATYSLRIKDYNLPISVMTMWNPQSNSAYMQLSAQVLTIKTTTKK